MKNITLLLGSPRVWEVLNREVYISNNRGWWKQRHYKPHKDVNIQHTLLDYIAFSHKRNELAQVLFTMSLQTQYFRIVRNSSDFMYSNSSSPLLKLFPRSTSGPWDTQLPKCLRIPLKNLNVVLQNRSLWMYLPIHE